MSQQSHCWAFTPRKPELKETHIPQILIFQGLKINIILGNNGEKIQKKFKRGSMVLNASKSLKSRWLLFRCSVVSDSLQPGGQQHARLPCPPPTLGACSDSCPLSQWCHPTISSPVVPFFCCPQSFPATGSFPLSWLFISSGQTTRVSASVLPISIQGFVSFRIDWFDLLGVQGTLKSLLQQHSSKASILQPSDFFMIQLTRLLEKQ